MWPSAAITHLILLTVAVKSGCFIYSFPAWPFSNDLGQQQGISRAKLDVFTITLETVKRSAIISKPASLAATSKPWLKSLTLNLKAN